MQQHKMEFSYLSLLAMVGGWLLSAWASGAPEQDQARKTFGQDRIASAVKNYDATLRHFQMGEVISDEVYLWSIRIREAQRDVASTAKERAEASTSHLARMNLLQKPIREYRGGKVCLDPMQVLAIDYDVKEAEYWVATSSSNAPEQDQAQKTLGQNPIASALENYDATLKLFERGEVTLDKVYPWSIRIREAQRDVAPTAKERAEASTSHLARMKTHLARMKAFQKSIRGKLGGMACIDLALVLAADYYLEEAEYWAATSSSNPAEQDRTAKILRQNCLAAAVAVYEETFRQYRLGMTQHEPVYVWSRRVFEWERDAAPTANERSKASVSHRARMIRLQKLILDLSLKDEIGPDAVLAADYYDKEAESWVASVR